ncbi:hypothetical protein Ciccas_006757 [Cichlidogyrus casuarinus]|uniref:Uncharacterized protein n=1 Tax=Cichlidogyrus casuarinus TaxID=1844966 RepID=A0ABD2Q5B2_9PLAT
MVWKWLLGAALFSNLFGRRDRERERYYDQLYRDRARYYDQLYRNRNKKDPQYPDRYYDPLYRDYYDYYYPPMEDNFTPLVAGMMLGSGLFSKASVMSEFGYQSQIPGQGPTPYGYMSDLPRLSTMDPAYYPVLGSWSNTYPQEQQMMMNMGMGGQAPCGPPQGFNSCGPPQGLNPCGPPQSLNPCGPAIPQNPTQSLPALGNPWMSPCMQNFNYGNPWRPDMSMGPQQPFSSTSPQIPRNAPQSYGFSPAQIVNRNPCNFYQPFDASTYNWSMNPYQFSSIYGPGTYNMGRMQPNFWSF